MGPIEGLHPLEERLVLDELFIVFLADLAAPENNAFLVGGGPDKVADLLLDLHEDRIRIDSNRSIGGIGILDISGVV